jgi:hypothetical protein
MTLGLRCSQPACRPHPASLPIRVPTVESLLRASFRLASRLRFAFRSFKKTTRKNRREVHNSAQFAVSSPYLRTSLEACHPEACSLRQLRHAKRCNAQHFTRAPAVAEISAIGFARSKKGEPGNRPKCTILHNSPFLRHTCEPTWNPADWASRHAMQRDAAFHASAVTCCRISAIGFARSKRRTGKAKIAAKCTNLHNSPFLRHKRR